MLYDNCLVLVLCVFGLVVVYVGLVWVLIWCLCYVVLG